MDPRLWALIQRFAPRYGLDPRAVAAIAMNESSGRLRAVGDSGSSFGPFQLHVGGALPAGRGLNWAASPAGIQYALRQMGSVARGLQGRAAISAIARRFERPADPAHEVQVALSYYGRPGFARNPGGGPVAGGGGGAGLQAPPRFGPPPQFVAPTFAPLTLPTAHSALQALQGLEPAPPAIPLIDPNQQIPSPVPSVDPLNALHSRLLRL